MDTPMNVAVCIRAAKPCVGGEDCCVFKSVDIETVTTTFAPLDELTAPEPAIFCGVKPEPPVPYELVGVLHPSGATTPVAPSAPDDNPKTRFGLRKPAMSSVPPAALIHLMRAMADGRRKYGLMNWREKNVSSTIYYDAAMRHLMAWFDGEHSASDSGVHHLGHAMACMAIILDAEAQGTLNDDRPVQGEFSALLKEYTET